MNTTGWMKGLKVTGDGTGVVSHAGVALVRALADATGLTKGLSRALASARLLVHDRGRVHLPSQNPDKPQNKPAAGKPHPENQQDHLPAGWHIKTSARIYAVDRGLVRRNAFFSVGHNPGGFQCW